MPEYYVCVMKEGFYALSKPDREALCRIIAHEWRNAIHQLRASPIQPRFEDSDTYIRKAAYTELKKLYFSGEAPLDRILQLLMEMRDHANPAVRQTVMNTIGEIANVISNRWNPGSTLTCMTHIIQFAMQSLVPLKRQAKSILFLF